MAEHQLAHWHEGRAQGSFRRRPCAHSGWTTTANSGQGPATSARRGGLAHRRTQDVGREETLSRQPAGKDGPAHLGGHHQGAMDLRAGSPADERRTRSQFHGIRFKFDAEYTDFAVVGSKATAEFYA